MTKFSVLALFALSLSCFGQINNPSGAGAGGTAGYTGEHVWSTGGSYTFNHALSSVFVQTTCINSNGTPLAPSSYTVAAIDANNTAIGVGAASDLICSFSAAANLLPYFAITAPNATVQPLMKSATTSIAVAQTIGGGYNSPVTYSASLPSGITGSFSPSVLTGNGVSTLTLTIPSSQAAGTFPINITGTDGVTAHTVVSSLAVGNVGTLNQGLVAGWPMNEGSGTTFTDAIGANNQTIPGTVGSWGSTPGFPGSTYSFNRTGGTTGASAAGTNFSSSSTFSIATWIYPTSIGGIYGILGNDPPANTGGYALRIDNDRLDLILTGVNQTAWINKETSAVFAQNTKYYVVVTYNGNGLGSGISFYVNGALQASNSAIDNLGAVSMVSAYPLSLGNDGAFNDLFSGTVAFTRIYNRVLTAQNVADYYALGVQ